MSRTWDHSVAWMACVGVCVAELCYGAFAAICLALGTSLLQWPTAILAFATGAVLAVAIVKRDAAFCLVWLLLKAVLALVCFVVCGTLATLAIKDAVKYDRFPADLDGGQMLGLCVEAIVYVTLLPAIHSFYVELKSLPACSKSAVSFSNSYRLNNTRQDSAFFEMKPRNTSSPASTFTASNSSTATDNKKKTKTGIANKNSDFLYY